MARWRHNLPGASQSVSRKRMGRTAAARATEARDTPIISPARLNVTSSLSADSRLASKARCESVQVTPVHVHRHLPRRHVGPALQLADLGDDTGSRAGPDRFRLPISRSPLTTTGSRGPLTRTSPTSSSNSRPDMTGNTAAAGWTRYRLPPISATRLRRVGAAVDPSTTFRVELVRTSRLAGSRSRTIAPAASCGPSGTRGLARTVVPSAPGAGEDQPAPNAGSRRRGGRRPRPDLERRSGLHPGAVKGDGRGMGGEPLPLQRRTRPA